MSEEVEFSVKTPSRPQQGDFRLRLPLSATVRDVKLRLQQDYPGNPAPEAVTVSRRQGAPSPRRRRRLAAGAVARTACGTAAPPQPPHHRPPPSPPQAIYAGKVLKEDTVALSQFVVPVSAQAASLVPAIRVAPRPSPPFPFPAALALG